MATAEALQVDSDEAFLEAGELAKTATAAVRAIRELFKPAKQAIDSAKKGVLNLEASLLSGFTRADAVLRAKTIAYNTERTRIAKEEQRRREEAERKRREDDKVNQAARLENLAVATGDTHYQQAAEQVLAQPVRAAVVPLEKPAIKGMTFREEVGVEVFDLSALVVAVAAGEVNLQAVLANPAWLRKWAETRAAALNHGDQLCPGVRVTKTQDVTVRTR